MPEAVALPVTESSLAEFGAPPVAAPNSVPAGGIEVRTPTPDVVKQDAADKALERPAWLPEKFKTPEDMAKSYAEMEKKFSQGVPVKEQGTAPILADLKVPEGLNLDFQKYGKEVFETQALSKESLAEITKAGIPEKIAIEYVQGQIARQQQSADKLVVEVGGAKAYREMVDWARQGLTKQEQAAFNAAVSRDEATAKLAIAALKAKFVDANGKQPSLVSGDTAPAQADVYHDRSQMMKDMNDPQYKKSEAFRNKVAAKLARSSILKVNP